MARRILLLITDLEIGGTPTVVRELATRLDAPPDVAVEVACLKGWGPVADQLRDAGVHVTALGATGVHQFPLALWRLVRLIRSSGVDTVFSFLVHANVVAAAASGFCRGVRFLQSIQTTQSEPRWHWQAQALAQGAADTIVVPSASVAEVARQRSDVPAGKLLVIPNAVDPDLFPRSHVPETDPRPYPVGFIGRLDPVKRVPWIVNGVRMRYEAKRDVELHVYGDGPDRPDVERVAGGQAWVKLHGAVPAPQQALARLGLLVLCSEAEGFGLVLIEAMAAGVPVIGTRAPGIRDVVRDGETGLLVDVPSPAALSSALDRIIDGPALRARLVANGLREVRERFSWSTVISQYRSLLGIPAQS